MNTLMRRPVLAWCMAIALLLLVLVVAFGTGKYPITPGELLRAIAARAGMGDAPSDTAQTVLWNIRLPRIAAGLMVGAMLGAAGAAYQGMFRNPLVSPDILGVSAGAGLGAAAAIFLGLPLPLVQLLAFAGGLIAVGTVYAIAGSVRRHDPVLVLVLTGVAIGALLGAGISLLKLLADPYTQLPSITFWLLGSLNAVVTKDVLATLPAILLSLLPLLLLRWRANLLSLSDEEGAALGVNVVRLRATLIAAATLGTAAAVSLAGIVGWVGLVVPHIARLLVGPEFSRLLPASLILGGGFLVGADTLARSIAGIELPLGILTALVGAPFFLFLLARGGKHK